MCLNSLQSKSIGSEVDLTPPRVFNDPLANNLSQIGMLPKACFLSTSFHILPTVLLTEIL